MQKFNMKNYSSQIILILLLLVNAAFSQTNNSKKEAQSITVGFTIQLFNDVDIRDAEVALKMWGNEVLSGLGVNYYPDTKIYKNTVDLIAAIKDGEIDLISLLTTDYFEIGNKVELEPSLITTSGGKIGFNFFLIVRKDRGLKNLKDLKNMQINIPSGSLGQLVKMWLVGNLFDNGLKHRKFFSDEKEVNKPSQALFPVFFKQADACVVSEKSYNTMIEFNPQLKNDLIIIDKSPELVNGLMCFNKKLDENTKTIIINTSLKISNSVSGKQLLALFRADDLIRFKKEDLQGTIDLYKKYKKIEKKELK